MTYLSNPMFRSFVWNQPFMCCVAFNLQTIIKSQNRILFRGLEAAAMAPRIGCDICAIRLLHTQLFLSPLPQCNVWKLPDEADLSGVQCEGVRWDHESFQLSISFVSHVWQKLQNDCIHYNAAHNKHRPLEQKLLSVGELLNSKLMLYISCSIFSFEKIFCSRAEVFQLPAESLLRNNLSHGLQLFQCIFLERF